MNNEKLTFLDLLERLGNLLRVDARRTAMPEGLQPVHLQALDYLRQANRYSDTPQALVEYLGATKGTVSQSLLLLHRKGLIERHADEKDGRVVRLRLSPAGKRLLLKQPAQENLLAALSGLKTEEINTGVAILRKLLTSAQHQQAGKSFGVCQTCQLFLDEGDKSYRCGLTGEKLLQRDIIKICREHTLKQA